MNEVHHELTVDVLQILCEGASGFDAARPLLLNAFRAHYEFKRTELGLKIEQDAAHAAMLRKNYSQLMDGIIQTMFDIVCQIAKSDREMALIAVGGYGRNEMAPYSDVDILFLLPKNASKAQEGIVEKMLYLLWDMGLKVGQSVRSISECLEQAQQDITIRTSLLEQRFLAGNEALASELTTRLRTKLFDKSTTEFVEAKLEERDQRHKKSGDTRYTLEPNVKEAKGGLRDLQTLYWIGKYITGVDTPEELAAEGFFELEELADFRESEDFLWTVRMCLHYLSGRANDVLSFDMQVEVAKFLGYQDTEHRLGVEIFMQQYFRAARQVGEITRVFITEIEARHIWKSRHRIRNFLQSALQLPDAFVMDNDRIDFADEAAVVEDPLNILRIFVVALETDRLIHPRAFRLMSRHNELINDEFKNSKEANRIFMTLLLDYGNPERALRRMNEIALLGEFIPAWARIDAMMQYNMYHSYTVDEHTIQCISNLSDIEKGKLVEDLPIASGILEQGVNRRVIYMAVLLHDIGKGLSRPHEVVGEEIAREIGPRFGLEPFEVELVAWLVRYHLEMSDAAQKRDLSDPKTVQDFVAIVDSQEKLDLLTVLTVCDIRGVGPSTWNNWKAMLLRELHALATDALITENPQSAAAKRESDAKSQLQSILGGWDMAELERELGRHYRDYWLGLPTVVHKDLAELLLLEESNEPRIRFSPDEDRDATRICFVMPDHPGLFARICGAVSLSGANIVDARTYTSSDGMATSVLWVQDDFGHTYDPARQDMLRRNVVKILHGELVAGVAIAAKSKIKKRERQFTVPTKVKFDNSGSQIYTIIEIETRDRMGLLFDISKALASANISISSAIIATYGEEAVDSFYVKDVFGLKIYSESKQKAIEERIRTAIEQGYKEALQ